MIENPLTTIFAFIGSFYGLVIPLLIIFYLSILFIAGMSAPGAKPKGVGEAIYTYTLHAVSVLLMTVGALPTVFSVFAGIAWTGRTYIALLLVFAAGGLLFLMQDQATRELDKASKAVIEAIYMTTLRVIGNGLALFSALSVFLSIVLASFANGWWVTPFVLLLYGLLLSWCTRTETELELLKTMQASVSAAPAKSTASKPRKSKRRKK